MAALSEIIEKYGSAWRETDDATRDALLNDCWADDGIYQDPTGQAKGRAALSKHIAATQSEFPGMSIVITSGIDSHGQVFRFDWQMTLGNGAVAVTGVDFGRVAVDGRLQEITGFFGPMPAA